MFGFIRKSNDIGKAKLEAQSLLVLNMTLTMGLVSTTVAKHHHRDWAMKNDYLLIKSWVKLLTNALTALIMITI